VRLYRGTLSNSHSHCRYDTLKILVSGWIFLWLAMAYRLYGSGSGLYQGGHLPGRTLHIYRGWHLPGKTFLVCSFNSWTITGRQQQHVMPQTLSLLRHSVHSSLCICFCTVLLHVCSWVCWVGGNVRFSWRRSVRQRTRFDGNMKTMSMNVPIVNRRSVSLAERFICCLFYHVSRVFCISHLFYIL